MKSLCILLIFFLLSCQTEKDARKLNLFNNIKFSLIEGEKRIELTSQSSDLFKHYVADIPFQVPLYLNIENSYHKIFVGLPLNTSLQDFLNYQKGHTNLKTQNFETDSVSYYFKKREEGDFYISEYVVDSNNSLLFVMTLTKSKKVSDYLFNYDNLSKRININ